MLCNNYWSLLNKHELPRTKHKFAVKVPVACPHSTLTALGKAHPLPSSSHLFNYALLMQEKEYVEFMESMTGENKTITQVNKALSRAVCYLG